MRGADKVGKRDGISSKKANEKMASDECYPIRGLGDTDYLSKQLVLASKMDLY